MKLYIKCDSCDQKIYLSTQARHKSELPEKFKLSCPNNVCKKEHEYKREDVIAEPSNGTGAGGAVVGGLLGLVGGPLGLIIGAIIGGVIGASTDQSDSEAANKFNSGG